MRRRKGVCWFSIVMILSGQLSAHGGDWPSWRKAKSGEPNTLEDVARAIDCLEDKILDDGTVVLKKPDVYGQARMTLYRKNFETMMFGAIGNFNAVASARLFRSDQAAIVSQTNVAAGLGAANSSVKSTSTTNTTVTPPSSGSPPPTLPAASGGGITPDGLAAGSIARPAANGSTVPAEFGNSPFSFNGTVAPSTTGAVGLEPTVYLDELKDFQDKLNQIRRINMGDDTADSAGYGLYLLRMPVSIQPGECTKAGHGAVLTATVRHDFGPDFLPKTFRNLVVNDLTDQLTPVVYELIRSKALNKKNIPLEDDLSPLSAEKRYVEVLKSAKERTTLDLYAIFQKSEEINSRVAQYCPPANSGGAYYMPLADKPAKTSGVSQMLAESAKPVSDLIQRMTTVYGTMTRLNDRAFPIPGSEFDNVFIEQNLVMLALTAQQASQTATPRSTDVRSFLRREIEAAYDIISQVYGSNDPNSAEIVAGFEAAVENIGLHIRTRDYRALEVDYHELARSLPGELQYKDKDDDGKPIVPRDPNTSLIDPLTILCYSIAVEAGLLDNQLRVDMKRVFGKDGADCSEIDALRFYRPQLDHPDPVAVAKFEEYVRLRWPLISFALYPQVDQQNIDDVNSTSRDLQIALAFAFSSGQINFQQLLQFQRRVVTDSEALALNRTITSFSHGDDTFGYRFTPRFQSPPPERTNFGVIANTLIKGGQGRDYRVKNSLLEAGQRELNAVIIMPSFLQGIQMDVTGNWFPLHDPDQMMTSTPRMIEQGRKVVELRESLNCIHDHKTYRKGDIQRLTTRVHQLEAMLPMQTQEIPLPYENTLGGFQLFQQGTTALVPQVDAFEGVDSIQQGQDVDLVLYGKHFSIQETHIIAGGKYMASDPLDAGSTPATLAASAASGTPATTQVEVVSRQVMRVHIPGPALVPTAVLDADGTTTRTYIELYVATPNGISNRLLIPFTPTPAAASTSTSTSLGYTLGVNAATIVYDGSVLKDALGNIWFGSPIAFDSRLSDPKSLTIGVASDIGLAANSISVDFQATFDGVKKPVDFVLNDKLTNKPKAYKFGKDNKGVYTIPLEDIAEAIQTTDPNLFAEIIRDLAKNPTVATQVQLTPSITSSDFVALPSQATNGLTITIKLNNVPTPVGAIPVLQSPLNNQAPAGPAPSGALQAPAPGTPAGDSAPAAPDVPPAKPTPAEVTPPKSTFHLIAPQTGKPVKTASAPRTPSPSLPGLASSRAPQALPARDAALKRTTINGVGNLPPLPAPATRPAPVKPSPSPKPATKPDPAGKKSDDGWRWPWQRQ